MRRLLTLLVSLHAIAGYAQITAPDTVCMNTPVSMSTTYEATTYTWTENPPLNIDQPFATPFTNTMVTGLNTPTYGVMKNDGGNWYSFITNYFTGEIYRISFGTSPLSATFTATSLGVMPGSRLEGIDIARDPITGDWYGVTVSDGFLTVLSFGTSLSSTPTITTHTAANMYWPHQVGLRKYGSQWVAFAADRSGTIVRADFGTSMSGTPTFTYLPIVGNMMNPCNFAIYKQGANYYMLVANLINNDLTLLNMGASIQNNTPTGTHIPNPGALLSLPRSVILSQDCDQLLGYVVNETGNVIKLDFSGDITNTPTASVAATGMSTQNGAAPFYYNGTQYWLICAYGIPGFYMTNMITYPAGSTTNYSTGTNSYTFTTPGLRNIMVLCDEQDQMGQAAFCKAIYVRGGGSVIDIPDTNICIGAGNSIDLDASPSNATGYLWSTGSTASKITITTPGTYWVQITGSVCGTGTDTVHVAARPGPVSGLRDTMACLDSSILLRPVPQPTGTGYLWSTGAAMAYIYGIPGNTYWLKLTSADGCTTTDTVDVGIAPVPNVALGSDDSICGNTTYTASVLLQAGSTYLWSNGETTPAANLRTGEGQWVRVTNIYGCSASDTINIGALPVPEVYLGPDSLVCDDTLILKAPPQPAGSIYIWSTGETAPTIKAIANDDMYWLSIGNSFGCSAIDSIKLSDLPHPLIEIGPRDTIVCLDEMLALPMGISSSGVSYLWSTGSTNERFFPNKAGTYWVEYSNECYKARDTMTIQQKNCNVWFPPAFSPNGDGLNDIAKLLGNIADLSNYELAIYNRWGQRIYETNNMYNGWDGRYKGKDAELGVYVYYIKYRLHGKDELMKGNVTLLR